MKTRSVDIFAEVINRHRVLLLCCPRHSGLLKHEASESLEIPEILSWSALRNSVRGSPGLRGHSGGSARLLKRKPVWSIRLFCARGGNNSPDIFFRFGREKKDRN